jgi:hypothetical protein
MAKRSKKRCEELPILHPDAAGIDVGASEMFVAVSADRDPQPVRSFPTFTRDLNAGVNRSGCDQDERLVPPGPHPPQHHPEQLMYGG